MTPPGRLLPLPSPSGSCQHRRVYAGKVSTSDVLLGGGATLLGALIGAGSAYVSVGRAIGAERHLTLGATSREAAEELVGHLAEARWAFEGWTSTRDPVASGELRAAVSGLRRSAASRSLLLADEDLSRRVSTILDALARYADSVARGTS